MPFDSDCCSGASPGANPLQGQKRHETVDIWHLTRVHGSKNPYARTHASSSAIGAMDLSRGSASTSAIHRTKGADKASRTASFRRKGSWKPGKRFLKSVLAKPVPGNLAWEPVPGNPCLGTSWEPCLGTSSWEPCLGPLAGNPCLGICSW